MSTFIDGSPPSVTPGPEDGDPEGSGRPVPERDEDGPDGGSVWLHEEIQRRIAAGRKASKGRHSRHEVASSTTSISYIPRHSTATPGPGALPPAPLATPARGIPRLPSAWSSPSEPPAGTAVDVEPPADPGPAERPVPEPPAPEPEPEGHRRRMLAGRVAIVPVDDRAVPSPWRSGDPLPAASARKARGLGDGEQAGDAVDGTGEPPQSRRVRVVLAERKGGARPVRTVVDIQEGTGVGELLRSNLIGSQLTVALRFAVVAGTVLGVLPVLFALFPEIGRTEVFGLRLPWLLLGVLVYPFLLGLGLWHTRTAERVEQNFADHVQD